MNRKTRPKDALIAVTLGDPAGIGPEVLAKSLLMFSKKERNRFVIVGDYRLYCQYAPKEVREINFIDCKNVSSKNIRRGRSNSFSARASLDYLDIALSLIKNKKAASLVTAPLCKEAVCAIGYEFHGHTEYIANSFNIKRFGMMFVADNLKTIVVTRHIPLMSISKKITTAKVLEAIMLINEALKNYFKIRSPRIAVCGLNPHAGEGGKIGKEEIKIICPAIKKAKKQKISICGPFAADTLFYVENSKRYDAIVAMYHDQGLIPLKTLYFAQLVNVTVGLPFVRTSPAHGTAFDIVGKNKADPSSMYEAMKLALKLTR